MAEATRVVLCPYCGFAQQQADKCRDCGGLFEPLSRRATQVSMGPWYVRDRNRPFRPGCSFEVIKKQVQAGKIKPTTIIRGPSTHQFWSVARHVPGLSHLLGYCYKCDAHVKPTDARCPTCLAPFREPWERNELGLLYPSAGEAAAAQRQIEREIAAMTGAPPPPPLPVTPGAGAGKGPSGASGGGNASASAGGRRAGYVGGDLLDEVIGKPVPVEGGLRATARPVSKPASSQRPAGAGVSARATARPGEGIDFTPSERATAESAGEDSAEGGKSRIGLVTWLLLIVVLAMLAVQVFLLMNQNAVKTTNDQGAGSSDSPRVKEPETRRRIVPPPPEGGSTDTDAAPAPSESPAPTPPKPATPLGDSTPAPSSADPAPPAPASAFTPPKPAAPNKKPAPGAHAPSHNTLTAEQSRKVAEADQLEAKQDYEQALAVLNATFKDVPPASLPKVVDQRIKTLEARIAEKKATKTLGGE